jgi:hypothetical protein
MQIGGLQVIRTAAALAALSIALALTACGSVRSVHHAGAEPNPPVSSTAPFTVVCMMGTYPTNPNASSLGQKSTSMASNRKAPVTNAASYELFITNNTSQTLETPRSGFTVMYLNGQGQATGASSIGAQDVFLTPHETLTWTAGDSAYAATGASACEVAG